MSRTKQDKTPWLLAGCIALTLSGVSAPAPAQTPSVRLAGVTTPSAPALVDDDGDGDELLEHWGDVRYSREGRDQMAGLLAFLGGAAAVALRRRATLRRQYRHD